MSVGEEPCADGSAAGGYIQDTYWIINWAEGYISDPDETLNFTSVDGNAFSIEQTLDLGSVTEDFALNLDTNSTTALSRVMPPDPDFLLANLVSVLPK